MNKIRSQQIVIDLPTETGEIWIRSTLQRCTKNPATYETTQVVDRVGHVHRSASDIIFQMTSFVDPVTGQTHTISGAGAAILIRDMVVAWILADRGGVLNEHHDVIEG